MYNPENQYRCTIIRGRSQTQMEDLLPFYANMVHEISPCKESDFKFVCRNKLSSVLLSEADYAKLSDNNKKTVDNHLTEIVGILFGLYYPITNKDTGETYIYESETCSYIVRNNNLPIFFKNLCLNFQFPNGAKSINGVRDDINHRIHIKPFIFVVLLLDYAYQNGVVLSKQEIGYYVLNNLDVLQGKVSFNEVYERIISDRANHIKREKLHGSTQWQHIKEQFNLLELANLVETDSNNIWINIHEYKAIRLFKKHSNDFIFDAYSYDIESHEGELSYFEDWKFYYGTFDREIRFATTDFGDTDIIVKNITDSSLVNKDENSTVEIGNSGEELVFKYEKERVGNFNSRLVNKVIMMGKTKGLGYDVLSIEADENPSNPEFARYIEVKTTQRVTEPTFDKTWMDSINLTAREWIVAQQTSQYYYIYRVYITKNKTIIVSIKNPVEKFNQKEIEVYPTMYQMNFNNKVLEIRHEE